MLVARIRDAVGFLGLGARVWRGFGMVMLIVVGTCCVTIIGVIELACRAEAIADGAENLTATRTLLAITSDAGATAERYLHTGSPVDAGEARGSLRAASDVLASLEASSLREEPAMRDLRNAHVEYAMAVTALLGSSTNPREVSAHDARGSGKQADAFIRDTTALKLKLWQLAEDVDAVVRERQHAERAALETVTAALIGATVASTVTAIVVAAASAMSIARAVTGPTGWLIDALWRLGRRRAMVAARSASQMN
jgi:CHASE3 domain sensor protein